MQLFFVSIIYHFVICNILIYSIIKTCKNIIYHANTKREACFFLKQEEVSWAKFSVRTGLSRGFISTVTDNLTAKTLDKIASAFPTLNAHWLLTGDGEMLKVEQHQENANKAIAIGRDANGSKINIESQENTDDFVKIVEKYQTQIDRLLAIIEKLTDKPIR